MADVAPWQSHPADPAGYAIQGLKLGADEATQRAAIARAIAEQSIDREKLAASMQMERMKLGASGAEAAARLAESARQADMDFQVKQAQLAEAEKRSAMQLQIQREKMQSQMLLQDQRLAIQDQYRQIQFDLRRQQLAETKRVNEEKTLDAARKLQANQMWAKRTKETGDAMAAAIETAAAGYPIPPSTMNFANRAITEIPEKVKIFEQEGEKFYLQGRKPIHIPRLRASVEGVLTAKERATISQNNKDIAKDEEWLKMRPTFERDTPEYKRRQKSVDDKRKEIDDILRGAEEKATADEESGLPYVDEGGGDSGEVSYEYVKGKGIVPIKK